MASIEEEEGRRENDGSKNNEGGRVVVVVVVSSEYTCSYHVVCLYVKSSNARSSMIKSPVAVVVVRPHVVRSWLFHCFHAHVVVRSIRTSTQVVMSSQCFRDICRCRHLFGFCLFPFFFSFLSLYFQTGNSRGLMP